MRGLPFPARWPRASSQLLLFAAMALPMWRMGAMLPRFFDVTHEVPIASGGPNLWTVAAALPPRDVELSGLAMALAAGTAAALLGQFVVTPPRRDRAVTAALLAALCLPWLLPAMTIADFCPAALLVLVDVRHRRAWDGMVCVGTALAAALAGLPALGAIAIALAIWRVARVVIVLPANDNALPLGPGRLYLPRRRDA